jgi:hypothetical protein
VLLSPSRIARLNSRGLSSLSSLPRENCFINSYIPFFLGEDGEWDHIVFMQRVFFSPSASSCLKRSSLPQSSFWTRIREFFFSLHY